MHEGDENASPNIHRPTNRGDGPCRAVKEPRGAAAPPPPPLTPTTERPAWNAGCLEQLREELTCAVCLELCIRPTTTLCGHTFCRGCLKRSLGADQQRRCPKCRVFIPEQPLAVHSAMWNIIQLLYPSHAVAAAHVESPVVEVSAAPPTEGPFVAASGRSNNQQQDTRPRRPRRTNAAPPQGVGQLMRRHMEMSVERTLQSQGRMNANASVQSRSQLRSNMAQTLVELHDRLASIPNPPDFRGRLPQRDSRQGNTRDLLDPAPGVLGHGPDGPVDEGIGTNGRDPQDPSAIIRRAIDTLAMRQRQMQDLGHPFPEVPVLPLPSRDLTSGAEEQEAGAWQEERPRDEPQPRQSGLGRGQGASQQRAGGAANESGLVPGTRSRDPFTRSRTQPGMGTRRGASAGGVEGRTQLDGVLAALDRQQQLQQEAEDHEGVIGDLLSRLSISAEEATLAPSGAASSASRAPRPYSLSRQQGTRDHQGAIMTRPERRQFLHGHFAGGGVEEVMGGAGAPRQQQQHQRSASRLARSSSRQMDLLTALQTHHRAAHSSFEAAARADDTATRDIIDLTDSP